MRTHTHENCDKRDQPDSDPACACVLKGKKKSPTGVSVQFKYSKHKKRQSPTGFRFPRNHLCGTGLSGAVKPTGQIQHKLGCNFSQCSCLPELQLRTGGDRGCLGIRRVNTLYTSGRGSPAESLFLWGTVKVYMLPVNTQRSRMETESFTFFRRMDVLLLVAYAAWPQLGGPRRATCGGGCCFYMFTSWSFQNKGTTRSW